MKGIEKRKKIITEGLVKKYNESKRNKKMQQHFYVYMRNIKTRPVR